MADSSSRSTLPLVLSGIALLLTGALAGWTYARTQGGTMDKTAVERTVREYILANPEILPEAMENLQKKQASQQLGAVGDKLEEPFPGAVLGNPNGTVTLVEFTDYACGYCRKSVPDVDALIAENPDLRVVVRELPIIAPTSPDAARWALAAAEQGKFPAFHKAMFAAGRTDAASIEAAARAAGLDLDRARKFVAQPQVQAELARNLEMARQLGIDGTPSWVAGDQLLAGAVGKAELGKAVAAARRGTDNR
ncbi:MAG TPA: DsbA family protein [Novosphingobium sp.]|nr:DsbA family protein [Novosphingobium sp.]